MGEWRFSTLGSDDCFFQTRGFFVQSVEMTHPALQGLRAALPIILGYFGMGVAAGIVGVQAGLSVFEITFMSMLLFAGSAQFAFAQLYTAGGGVLVPAIFLINIRHLLYAASFAPLVKHKPTWLRFIIGAQLTDETFAVASAILRNRPLVKGSWMVSLNCAAYFTWCLSNMLGAMLGSQVLELERMGLDFTLAAMYAAILMLLIIAAPRLLAALVVAGAAFLFITLLELWLPSAFSVLLAAIGAATLATFLFGITAADEDLACGRLE